MVDGKIAKGVGLVGAVLGIAWVAIQINDHWNRPRPIVRATAEYGPLIEAPESIQSRERLRRLDEGDWLYQKLYPGSGEQAEKKAINKYSASLVQNGIRDELRPISFKSPPSGFIRFSLANEGARTAEDLRLTVPYLVGFVLTTETGSKSGENGSQIQEIAGNVISIPNLRAGETATVIAYTSTEPASFSLDGLRLAHSGGFSNIDVKVAVGRVGQFFDNFWGLVLLGVLFLFFVTVGPLASHVDSLQKQLAAAKSATTRHGALEDVVRANGEGDPVKPDTKS